MSENINDPYLLANDNFYNNIQLSSFLLTSDHPEQYYEQMVEAMNKGYNDLEKMNIDAGSMIQETFFSARNIDIIQQWLVKDVRRRTNTIIPYQKIEHILMIMNLIYNTYAQNLPFGLKEQIRELDSKVVGMTVPTIVEELRSRVNYLDTIQNANYIDNPVNTVSRRALPSTCSFI